MADTYDASCLADGETQAAAPSPTTNTPGLPIRILTLRESSDGV